MGYNQIYMAKWTLIAWLGIYDSLKFKKKSSENIETFGFGQTDDLGWIALRCSPATTQFHASREAQLGTLQSQGWREYDIDLPTILPTQYNP